MHSIRPPIPPKPKLLPDCRDSRDSGISVTDHPAPPKPPGIPTGVRQLASRFETIALRHSSPLDQRGATRDRERPPTPPKKPSSTTSMQQLQMTLERTLGGGASSASRWESDQTTIEERIYDTVHESDRAGHLEPIEPVEPLYEELDDPTLTDGYSSFESSTDDEDDHEQPSTPKTSYSMTPHPDSFAPSQTPESPEGDHLQNVIAELIEKERRYIETLDHGIRQYTPVLYSQTLPAALRGQRNVLFINLEDILRTHRDHLLVDLERAASVPEQPRNSGLAAERIAEVFLHYIENDRLYCYVQFALHQADSEALRQRYDKYFQKIQHDMGDKLGLNSLLLQPIQRLPRYKLLFNELVKDLLKDDGGKLTMSRRTALLCKVDRRLGILIDRVNQAINLHDIRQCSGSTSNTGIRHGSDDVPLTLILHPEGNRNPARDTPINLVYQGKFQCLFVVDIYDMHVRRKYSGKLFVFEKLLLYAEIQRDRRLEYRGHFSDTELSFVEEGLNRFVLFAGPRGSQEITLHFDSGDKLKTLNALVHTMTKTAMYGSVEIIDRLTGIVEFGEEPTEEDEYPSQHDVPDTWDEETLTTSLVAAQEQFLEVLIANRQFYLDPLSAELKQKLTSFTDAFEAIMDLHRRILHDLSQPPMNPDKVCQCFDLYLKTDFFDPYFNYLRVFRMAMKRIQHSQTPSNFNNRVASTVEQFTFLCIKHLQEFSRYLSTLTDKYAENSTLNIPIDKELFQRLAYVLVRLDSYRTRLTLNYKLFLLDEHAPSFGLMCYNERVTVSDATALHTPVPAPCRVFLLEKAVVCVRIHDVPELDGQLEERFTRVLFHDGFQGRGVPMRMRRSKRQPQRLNFLVNGIKYRIDFESPQAQSTFYNSYVQRYTML
uniref:DH domain-containing protein n=1 Tax=Anopheles farauti TaxID=69004 RepID=A0A182Q3W9_9DIPT